MPSRKNPVYHPFEKSDIQHTVIHTNPFVTFFSGTSGYFSNQNNPSASLSLYEGVRARTDVKPGSGPTSGLEIYPIDLLPNHIIDKVIFVSGSYPATGSIRVVQVRTTPAQNLLTGLGSEDWFQEHWSPIERLYNYYSQFNENYFTGSWDYTCTPLIYACVGNSMPLVPTGSNATASFTFETFFKCGLTTQDITFGGQSRRWSCGVKNSNFFFQDASGTISNGSGLLTGSADYISNWHRFAVTVSGTLVKFYVDGQQTGSSIVRSSASLSYTTASLAGIPITASAPYTIGGLSTFSGSSTATTVGTGYLFSDVRLWNYLKSPAQLSGAAFRTLTQSEMSDPGLISYVRFNDGPYGFSHGFAVGSGAFDYSPQAIHAQLMSTVSAGAMVWQRHTSPDFITSKVKAAGSGSIFRVIHVPSMFYGRQIATGSVQIELGAITNESSNAGFSMYPFIIDDGRGSLYLSGSAEPPGIVRSSRSVPWNKVGNVFYSEGLIVFTDPWLAFMDRQILGQVNPFLFARELTRMIVVRFRGDQRINTETFMCRLGQAQGNGSNNPTYVTGDANGRKVLVSEEPVTYVTSVGLYNENRELVAVAKIAQPIRKREQDSEDIRLKMDF